MEERKNTNQCVFVVLYGERFKVQAHQLLSLTTGSSARNVSRDSSMVEVSIVFGW